MSYSIAVPQPCVEDWDEMIPGGCGRFCAACEQMVVDFTTFSDEDFIAYFNIDPGEIKSKGMKDIEAMVIYGAAGMNGVVIIDTKHKVFWKRWIAFFKKK